MHSLNVFLFRSKAFVRCPELTIRRLSIMEIASGSVCYKVGVHYWEWKFHCRAAQTRLIKEKVTAVSRCRRKAEVKKKCS